MTSLRELGAELKLAREERGLSLESLAADLRIKLAHLQAIESGNESALPEPVYVKIFIRKLALAVGLDGEMLAAAYWALHAVPPPEPEKPQMQVAWWILPWIIGAVLVTGVVTLSVAERRLPPIEIPPSSDSTPGTPGHVADATVASSSLPASNSLAMATDSLTASGDLAATESLTIATGSQIASGDGQVTASSGALPAPGATRSIVLPPTTGTIGAPRAEASPPMPAALRQAPLTRRPRPKLRVRPKAVRAPHPATSPKAIPAKPANTPRSVAPALEPTVIPPPPDDIEIPD